MSMSKSQAIKKIKSNKSCKAGTSSIFEGPSIQSTFDYAFQDGWIFILFYPLVNSQYILFSTWAQNYRTFVVI